MLSKKLYNKFFQTLAFKLTFSFSAVLVILSFAGFISLYYFIQHYLYTKIDEELHTDYHELAEMIVVSDLDAIQERFDEETESDDPEFLFYRLVDSNLKILAHTNLDAWSNSQFDSLATSIPESKHLRIQSILIRDGENISRIISGKLPKNQILQIGFLIDDELELLERFRFYACLILLFILLLACWTGQRIAAMSISGINNVTKTAELIAKGNLQERVAVSNYGLELQNLGNTFNQMTDRIEMLIREMNELNDNIAHDLRIPITRMRGIAEEKLTSKHVSVDCAKMCEDVIEESDNLLHITNTMLDISELDSGVFKLDMEPIDLYALVIQMAEMFQPVLEDQNVALKCQTSNSITIHGDRRKMQRALSNLIDNAIKYTQPGGKISISLAKGNPSAILTVSDTGIGISPSEQAKVFQRFYRCNKSRNKPGNGLGLSFAQSVIRAHNGEISLVSTEGNGTTFTITLPLYINT